MTYTEILLKDSKLTEAMILENLGQLSRYYQDMEVETQLIPVMEDLPLPTLLAVMESDRKGRVRMISHSFIPVDRENAEFTKYLQFYLELENTLEGISEADMMEMLCWMNSRIPVGSCILREADEAAGQPRRVAVRSTQGFPLSGPIDQGVFTEDVFLFDASCDMVSTMLDLLAEGKSPEEVQKALKNT